MMTRMFARSMVEAFGPYTDNVLHEPPQAVVDGWIEWRKKHQQPENDESYQQDILAEQASMRIPGER